jgi:hypothetical protein
MFPDQNLLTWRIVVENCLTPFDKTLRAFDEHFFRSHFGFSFGRSSAAFGNRF